MTDLSKRYVVAPGGYGLGWRRDPPDQRDAYYSAPVEAVKKLPKNVQLSDIWKKMPVYDQGALGSCTANAIGALLQYEQVEQSITSFTPSRLFIYYFERYIEGTTDSDSGAVIRDGMKVVNRMGAPPEAGYWPYDISRFAAKPSDAAVTEALKHQALSYRRVTQTPTQVRTAISSGYPIVFGFTVYSNFYDVGSDGIVDMPSGSIEGGHAVVICGYNDDTQRFTVRNSWGDGWGWDGYCYMPYAYVLDHSLASDFWLVSKVES
jgi:C1A family cysteine protease